MFPNYSDNERKNTHSYYQNNKKSNNYGKPNYGINQSIKNKNSYLNYDNNNNYYSRNNNIDYDKNIGSSRNIVRKIKTNKTKEINKLSSIPNNIMNFVSFINNPSYLSSNLSSLNALSKLKSIKNFNRSQSQAFRSNNKIYNFPFPFIQKQSALNPKESRIYNSQDQKLNQSKNFIKSTPIYKDNNYNYIINNLEDKN